MRRSSTSQRLRGDGDLPQYIVPTERVRLHLCRRAARGTAHLMLIILIGIAEVARLVDHPPEGTGARVQVLVRVRGVDVPGLARQVVLPDLQAGAYILHRSQVLPVCPVVRFLGDIAVIIPRVGPAQVVVNLHHAEGLGLRGADRVLLLLGEIVRPVVRVLRNRVAAPQLRQELGRLVFVQEVEVPERVRRVPPALARLLVGSVELVVPDVVVLLPVRALVEVRDHLAGALLAFELEVRTVREPDLRPVGPDPALVPLAAH